MNQPCRALTFPPHLIQVHAHNLAAVPRDDAKDRVSLWASETPRCPSQLRPPGEAGADGLARAFCRGRPRVARSAQQLLFYARDLWR